MFFLKHALSAAYYKLDIESIQQFLLESSCQPDEALFRKHILTILITAKSVLADPLYSTRKW